jgi:hypothetical protein
MAIIDEIPGLEVQILVDSRPLREYEEPADTNDDDGSKVTRYIEAQPGKTFQVQLYFTGAFKHFDDYDMCGFVKVDGRTVNNPLMKRSEYRDAHYLARRITGSISKVNGVFEERAFLFDELKIGSYSGHRLGIGAWTNLSQTPTRIEPRVVALISTTSLVKYPFG